MSVLLADRGTFDPIRDKSYQATGLGRAIADYLARKANQGRAQRTLIDKERYLSSLALLFPHKQLGDLTSSDVDHWISQQSAGSRRHRASHINDFLEWAVRWDHIVTNPMDRLDPIPMPKQKTYDIFTEPDMLAMTNLSQPNGALMMLMLDTGLRKSECRNLQARHILDEPAPGQIRVIAGKGGKDRLVPLTRRLSQALADLRLLHGLNPTDHLWADRPGGGPSWRRSKPIGETSFHRWWVESIDAADVTYRNPHTTRHTFATRYLRAGGRLETLSMVMGHASIKTTADLYSHLDTRDVAIDIALLGV
jgi:integrase